MATYTDVETLMTAAKDADLAANYSEAETEATAALALFSVLPVVARKEGHASGSFRYSELLINNFIDRIKNLAGRKKQNSTTFGI